MHRTTAAALLLLLAGCEPSPRVARPAGLSEAIAGEVRRGTGTSFCLASLRGVALEPGTEWDRVSVFEPYTTPEQLHEVLGVDWDGPDAEAIRDDDHSYLFVFQAAGRVVGAGLHATGNGYFGPDAVSRSYAKEDACFVVDTLPKSGMPMLRPATPEARP